MTSIEKNKRDVEAYVNAGDKWREENPDSRTAFPSFAEWLQLQGEKK